MPDNEIIKIIFDQTNKMISERRLYELRQNIKKDSCEWYKTMREGQYDTFMSSRTGLMTYYVTTNTS